MQLPQVWRLRTHNYRLEGGACKYCGIKVLTRRAVCPECQGRLPVRIPIEIVSSVPLFERRIPVPVPVRIDPPDRR